MAGTVEHTNIINRDALYRAKDCANLYSVGLSTWWKWVSDGRVKPGIKLGPKTTVWEGEYLLDLRQKFIREAQG